MSNVFCRELLPPVRQFYEQELGELRRPSRGWATPKSGCPFHESRSKKSFSVNLESGGYYCFSCGAKGDMVSFVMKRYDLGFVVAAKQLGAYEETGKKSSNRRKGALKRYLVMDFVVDGVQHSAEVLDEPQTELQQLRRFHAEAADRLAEIRHGDIERFEDEAEIQWSILQTSWELMQIEAEHGQ
jgi:CHC2 zinc finger